MKFRYYELNYKNYRRFIIFLIGIFVYVNNYIIILDDNFDKLFKVDKRMGSYRCMKWDRYFNKCLFFLLLVFFFMMLDCRFFILVNVVKNNFLG